MPPHSNSFNNNVGDKEDSLRVRAKQILYERGCLSVAEELSRPVIHTFPPELLAYLAEEWIQAQDEPMHVTPVQLSAQFLASPCPITHLNASCMHTSILKTGCSTLDDLFDGGIPVAYGDILEISGTASVGKTQLAMQLALMSAVPECNGGLASAAVCAFTEGPPPVGRMRQIEKALCKRFKLPGNSLLSSVVVEKIDSVDDLLFWAEVRLPYLLRETKARVVLVDSVTALYRPEFEDARSRANHLVKMAMALKRAVNEVRGICICVNQVTQRFEIDLQTMSTTAPALGVTWANCVETRVFLKRRGHGCVRRFARVLHSSYLAVTEGEGEAYEISEFGVTSPEFSIEMDLGREPI